MENKITIFKTDGSEAGSIDVNDAWIELDKGTQAVHDTVVAFLAKHRSGTASAKTRSEIRGSGAKPYRQKGTGRARAGSRKSPIWRGGGITFGPKPRSYAKKVNSKVQKLALKRAFSERLSDGDVIVVDSIDISAPKTKEIKQFLAKIHAGEDVLIVVDQLSDNLMLGSRNLPDAEAMTVGGLNPYWTLLFKKIVITKPAFDILVERFETKKAVEQ